MRILASIWSLFWLAAKRLWSRRWLMLCLLLGLVVAVGLLSSIPLYADAAQNRLLQGELENSNPTSGAEVATLREPFSFLWRYIGTWHGNVTWDKYLPVQQYLTEQAPLTIGLPLKTQVRHVATDKLRLFPGEGAAFIPDEPLLWASVGFVSGLQDHIQIIEGSFPSTGLVGEPVEVLISQTTADLLGLQVGELYILFAPGKAGVQIPVRIAGVWQAADATDPIWFYRPEAFNEVLLTGEEAFISQVAPALDTPVATAVWYQIYDGSRVRPATVNRLLGNIAAAEARVTVLLNNTSLDASPVPALKSYGKSASLLTLVLTIFSLPVIGLVAYFISLIAGMVVQRGQSEIAILRSRGITRRQILNLYLLEGTLLGGLGLAGGLLLGRFIAQLMSRTRTFLDPGILAGSGSQPVVIILTPTALAYALAGVALTLIALLIPALLASKHSIVTLRWEQGRSLLAPLWQRYFLDLLLLVPPFYGWYQLSKQGTIALGTGGNDPFSNPLLFLVPVLFCFSLALLCMRFFPLLIKLLAWLVAWLPGTTLLLTLRQLARSTGQYMGPLLLLSLTVSLATFTASMAVTLDNHLTDQVYYQVGTDLNLAELGESTEETTQVTLPGQTTTTTSDTSTGPQWLFLPVSDHLSVPGVKAAARVGNYSATARIGGRQQAGRLLGIDRLDFPAVAFYRPDFAYNESLGALMNRLAVSSDGILVSSGFLNQQGLAVGDPLRLTVGVAGEYAEVQFTVVGALNLFPTLYPQDGPFFVANLEHIYDALGGTYPYDVWLATDPSVSGGLAGDRSVCFRRGDRGRGARPGIGRRHQPGCPADDRCRADAPRATGAVRPVVGGVHRCRRADGGWLSGLCHRLIPTPFH